MLVCNLLLAVGALLAAVALHRQHPARLGVAFAAGAMLWPLVEYVVHRWVLHGALSGSHRRHHVDPQDRRVLHGPLDAWAITVVSSSVLFCATLGPAAGLACFAGLDLAYVAFEMVHYACHIERHPRWLQPAVSWHALHHYADENSAFGFVSPFWDWVFGTLPARGRSQRPLLRLVPLPIPMLHFALAALLDRAAGGR